MDESKFHLWRASFAFCYVDSHLSEAEEKWILGKVDTLNFTDLQKKQIQADLKDPPKVLNLLAKITNAADRGMLLNNVRQVAHLDEVVSEEEQKKIQILRDEIMSRLDISTLHHQIKSVEKADQISNRHSFIESTISAIQDKLIK